jgi:hypothetical protein
MDHLFFYLFGGAGRYAYAALRAALCANVLSWELLTHTNPLSAVYCRLCVGHAPPNALALTVHSAFHRATAVQHPACAVPRQVMLFSPLLACSLRLVAALMRLVVG